MSDTIKLRSRQDSGYTELKILIRHPMENGRQRDPETQALIAAHHIEDVTVKVNDRVVLTMNMAGSISKDPFFSVRLKTAQPGDRIRVEWRDNLNAVDSAELVLE